MASDETLDECQFATSNQAGYDDIHEQYRCTFTRQIVFVPLDASGAGLEVTADTQAVVFEANGLQSDAPFGTTSTAALIATQDSAYAFEMRPVYQQESHVLRRQRQADDALLANLASTQQAALVLTIRDQYFDSDSAGT